MKDVSGRYRPAALLLLAPALALGGCGGGDGKAAGAGDAGRSSAIATASPSFPASSSASVPRGAVPSGPAGGTAAPTVVPRPSGVAVTAFNGFAACMRRHGIDFPDAGQTYTPGPAQNPAEARIALAACEKLLRGRGPAAN